MKSVFIFSIVISGIVILALNSKLYLGPFFISNGIIVTDYPNLLFFLA